MKHQPTYKSMFYYYPLNMHHETKLNLHIKKHEITWLKFDILNDNN